MNLRSLRLPAALTAAAAAAALIVLHPHWLVHALGIDTQQSWPYDFTSGSGPMLLTAISMTTLIAGAWHHVNCNVDGCHRIARYHVAGGQLKVCRRHHPEPGIRDSRVSEHHIAERHRRHHQDRP